MQARLAISVGALILKNAVEAVTDPKPRRRQAATGKTVESIIRTGKLLIEAKAKLKHGDFIAMLRSDLPFRERTAQRLMCIARRPNLANASTWTYLPAHLRTLNDLAALPGPTFDVKVASSEINPSMTRTQLRIETPRPLPSTLTSDEKFGRTFVQQTAPCCRSGQGNSPGLIPAQTRSRPPCLRTDRENSSKPSSTWRLSF
jgi:hypothetical protein